MNAWILYDGRDLRSNMWFAEKLRSGGESLGIRCKIVLSDSMPEDVPDLVVSRCRDWRRTERLERQGAVVVNSSKVSRICNDKSTTYRFAGSLGIPYLGFSFPGDPLPPGPPWVVKSCLGHGGTEVFMADDPADVPGICSSLKGRKPIVQEMASRPGMDMRVYMLGDRPLVAVMRTGDADFRANHSLGGKAEVCEVPEDIERTACAAAEELESDLVGVDFVFGDGRAYLNEIEDVAGTRMLYELTDLDPARLLMERAHSKMSL